MKLRVGLGYDIHAFAKNRKLVLAGILIPSKKGLSGHSDADAVWHALTDAILGAMGAGDIGQYFPDTKATYKSMDSAYFLKYANKLMKKDKMSIENIDINIITQQPKIGPYRQAMIKSTAKALGVAVSRINVKAKTNEGFDSVGRAQALSVQAIVLLRG